MCVNNAKGFTLLELIITLVLIGVLSVNAAPLLFGKRGFGEHAYQARLISALQTMQQRAMQDTRQLGFCYQINIFKDGDSAFGPATLDYQDDSAVNQTTTCTRIINSASELEFVTATNAEILADGVTITAGPDEVNFNSLGCPDNCSLPVQIDITGQSTVSVCVESQGYIHAGAC